MNHNETNIRIAVIAIAFSIIKKIAEKIKEEKEERRKTEKWLEQKQAEKEAKSAQQTNPNCTPLANSETHTRDNALFIENLRTPEKQQEENESSEYSIKKPMTRTESKLYFRLIKALPEFIVLAQVQMTSFLEPKAKKWTPNHTKQLNKIIRKSIDFVVMDKSGNNITAIELQDWTHQRKDRQKNDDFKRQTLANAGIKFLEFHAENMPSIEEIQSHFNVTTIYGENRNSG
jgi:hypothetical protein